MNARKVPQLFVATGATKWGDPQNFPWTMGWQPDYQSEGRIYAVYVLKNYPNGKIAALWQNDDAGDFFPIEQMQLMKFNGEAWEVFGDIITGEVGH